MSNTNMTTMAPKFVSYFLFSLFFIFKKKLLLALYSMHPEKLSELEDSCSVNK